MNHISMPFSEEILRLSPGALLEKILRIIGEAKIVSFRAGMLLVVDYVEYFGKRKGGYNHFQARNLRKD